MSSESGNISPFKKTDMFISPFHKGPLNLPLYIDAVEKTITLSNNMTLQTRRAQEVVGLFEESESLGVGYKYIYDDEEQEETSGGEDSSATPSSRTTTAAVTTSQDSSSPHRPRAMADSCERLSPPHALPVHRIGQQNVNCFILFCL